MTPDPELLHDTLLDIARAVGAASRTEVPEPSRCPWHIVISDSYCSHEYVIDGTGNASIQEIAEFVAAFLEGEIESSQAVTRP